MFEPKIVDYCLASATWNFQDHKWYGGKSFTETVKQLMQQGWQPLGGVSVYMDSAYDKNYTQAMVKYEE